MGKIILALVTFVSLTASAFAATSASKGYFECSTEGIEYNWHNCGPSTKAATKGSVYLCKSNEPKSRCNQTKCWQINYACDGVTGGGGSSGGSRPEDKFTYCDFHPTAPACESGGYYCRAHPTDPACRGGSDYCDFHPTEPSCRP